MTKKILVVDDEVVLTKMVKMNLERTGKYEVRTENSGSKALQAVRDFKPDLIFMDVMMPDMSGDEVIAEIREDRSSLKKCSRVCVGMMPRRILILARLVSASNRHTFFPAAARAIPRLLARVLLPTPPLPLEMAITLAKSCSG